MYSFVRWIYPIWPCWQRTSRGSGEPKISVFNVSSKNQIMLDCAIPKLGTQNDRPPFRYAIPSP